MGREGALFFRVTGRDAATRARTGILETSHGEVATPAFMPVGTRGTVKALEPRDLRELGFELILSNAYRTALTAFSKTLAGELAPFGVTVNCVCPGYTDTERLQDLSATLAAKGKVPPGEIRREWERSIPAGRLGRPGEVADLIAFLVSERAGYITGVSILVDGGLVRALV